MAGHFFSHLFGTNKQKEEENSAEIIQEDIHKISEEKEAAQPEKENVPFQKGTGSNPVKVKNVTSIWDSKAEEVSYGILQKLINCTNYDIRCHFHLNEIFESDNRKEQWSDYHVDFLITDKHGYPVMAIEINGPEHYNNKEVKRRDKIKKEQFMEKNIPVVDIPIIELPRFEDYGKEYPPALERMIKNCLMPYLYRASYPVYSWKDKEQYLYLCRKDYTANFYACPVSEQTYSSERIPELLNKEQFE